MWQAISEGLKVGEEGGRVAVGREDELRLPGPLTYYEADLCVYHWGSGKCLRHTDGVGNEVDVIGVGVKSSIRS